jgi:hypothetical protein
MWDFKRVCAEIVFKINDHILERPVLAEDSQRRRRVLFAAVRYRCRINFPSARRTP